MGMVRSNADQAFHYRKGISSALGREPRAGRAGSTALSQQHWKEQHAGSQSPT